MSRPQDTKRRFTYKSTKRKDRDGWQLVYHWTDPVAGVYSKRERRSYSSQKAANDAGKEQQHLFESFKTDRPFEEKDKPAATALTFSDLGKEFLKNHTGKRRSNHYEQNVKLILEDLGLVDVRTFRRVHADAYRRRLETETQLGPGSILKRLRVLSRMLRYAVGREYIEYNPTTDMEKPSPPRHNVFYFRSQVEVESLLAAAPPWVRPLLEFAVASGLRLKELGGLVWGDVDLARGLVFVPMDSKTGARTVRVGAYGKQILERQWKAQRFHKGRVFQFHDGTAIDTQGKRNLTSYWGRRAARAAGIELPGNMGAFIACRHTFASWSVQAGVPILEVGAMLGHSSPTMTQRYAHLAPGAGEGTAAAIDAAMGINCPRAATIEKLDLQTTEQ